MSCVADRHWKIGASLPFSLLGLMAMAYAQPLLIEVPPQQASLQKQLQEEIKEIKGTSDSRFEARRKAKRASSLLLDYLNSQAYFAATAETEVVGDGPFRGKITLSPGTQFRLDSTKIDFGATNINRTELLQKIDFSTGDIALPQYIIDAEQSLKNNLQTDGFAFAKINKRQTLGDKEKSTLDVTLRLDPGPKIHFGEAIVNSRGRTRPTYLKRLVPFEKGDLYSPKALGEYNARLNETRLYTTASAKLSETVRETKPDGSQIRDIIVTLQERDRFTLSTGASFSTNEGIGLTGAWTNRNFTRRGDVLTVSTVLAEQEQSLQGRWQVPNAVGYGRSLTFNGNAGTMTTDAFDRSFVNMSGALDYKNNSRQTFSFGGAGEFSRETVQNVERDLLVLSLSGGARLDYANDPLNPTKGWRLETQVEPGTISGDISSQYLRSLAQATAYQTLGSDRLVLAGRLKLGSVYGTDRDDLPTSRRFYAGGGGSARGYAFQAIGPELDGTPIGGRSLVESSTELRWRFRDNFGAVAFLDGASVTRNELPNFDDMQYGAGIGVRYYTAIGPIRLDIATPLNKREGDEPVQLYISLGQAF